MSQVKEIQVHFHGFLYSTLNAYHGGQLDETRASHLRGLILTASQRSSPQTCYHVSGMHYNQNRYKLIDDRHTGLFKRSWYATNSLYCFQVATRSSGTAWKTFRYISVCRRWSAQQVTCIEEDQEKTLTL